MWRWRVAMGAPQRPPRSVRRPLGRRAGLGGGQSGKNTARPTFIIVTFTIDYHSVEKISWH